MFKQDTKKMLRAAAKIFLDVTYVHPITETQANARSTYLRYFPNAAELELNLIGLFAEELQGVFLVFSEVIAAHKVAEFESVQFELSDNLETISPPEDKVTL